MQNICIIHSIKRKQFCPEILFWQDGTKVCLTVRLNQFDKSNLFARLDDIHGFSLSGGNAPDHRAVESDKKEAFG